MRSTALAEHIVSKETRWKCHDCYDVKTLVETEDHERQEGVFAKLMRLDPDVPGKLPLYRICLQDTKIFEFIQEKREIDMFSLLTFIMTHELLHIHRFSTGKADYFEETREDEEIHVDNLTRLFLAKNPVNGLKNVLTLLDKVEAAPLYSFTMFIEHGRYYNAYL